MGIAVLLQPYNACGNPWGDTWLGASYGETDTQFRNYEEILGNKDSRRSWWHTHVQWSHDEFRIDPISHGVSDFVTPMLHIVTGRGSGPISISCLFLLKMNIESCRGSCIVSVLVSGAYHLLGILSPRANCLRGRISQSGLSQSRLSRESFSRGTMSPHL